MLAAIWLLFRLFWFLLRPAELYFAGCILLLNGSEPTHEAMKNVKLFFLLAGLTAASCSPKFYSPNTQNVPLITEQGQFSLNVNGGGGGQVGFQGAVGLTDAIAVQVNGGLFIPGELDNGNGGSGNFAEGGVGFYRPIGSSFVFETYGLFGFGRFENHLPSTMDQYPGTSGKMSGNILRYGFQPNLGFVTKYFTIAVSSRLVLLDYYNIDGNLTFEDADQVAYLKDNRSSFLLEPALTIRGGVEKVKLQLQVGTSVNVTNSDFRQDKGFATIGLNFNLK